MLAEVHKIKTLLDNHYLFDNVQISLAMRYFQYLLIRKFGLIIILLLEVIL